jgi:hypothetical protein
MDGRLASPRVPNERRMRETSLPESQIAVPSPLYRQADDARSGQCNHATKRQTVRHAWSHKLCTKTDSPISVLARGPNSRSSSFQDATKTVIFSGLRSAFKVYHYLEAKRRFASSHESGPLNRSFRSTILVDSFSLGICPHD